MGQERRCKANEVKKTEQKEGKTPHSHQILSVLSSASRFQSTGTRWMRCFCGDISRTCCCNKAQTDRRNHQSNPREAQWIGKKETRGNSQEPGKGSQARW
jgi:hypothetical protein